MEINRDKRIYLSPPHMGTDERKYIDEAFQTNWIAPLGPNLDAFERELAEWIGIKGAVGLSSGTAAIHLALNLLRVGQDDIVFCSDLTFVASANPILYQSAIPVFIDSEPDTWNMSPHALERALFHAKKANRIPKAVIIANLFGQSADMDPLLSLCQSYNVEVIEDAAESLGAKYKGKDSGTFGKFGIFSFNGNKIISTSGGGMLVSEDLEALSNARFLSTQARDAALHYQHHVMGYNYRLSNILAGIGRGQMKVLPERIEARRKIYYRYKQELSTFPGISFKPELDNSFSTHWLSTMLVNPDIAGVDVYTIIDALQKQNIESRPVWKPMHMQPLFQDYEYYTHYENESVSKRLFLQGICLPSGSSLTDDEQSRVIHCIQNVLRKK